MSISFAIEASLASIDIAIEQALAIEAEFAAALIEREIAIMRLGGLTDAAITEVLEADFAAKGRIFRQIDNAARAHVVGSLLEASNNAQDLVYQAEGFTDMRKWVVVNLGARAVATPCPDCITRQGRIEPMSIWRSIGLPGSGWSVCKQHCYCVLVPETVDLDIVDIEPRATSIRS